MIWYLVLIAALSPLSVQNVLPQIPKLKHVIYVDQKKVSTEGYPAGLSIQSMQAVQELGALPENSVYFSDSSCLCLIVKFRSEKLTNGLFSVSAESVPDIVLQCPLTLVADNPRLYISSMLSHLEMLC